LIVLDAHAVSEMMRPAPYASVLNWPNAQVTEELWLNSVVVSELLFGMARLPGGARKRQLAETLAVMLSEDFAGRTLSFDQEAAVIYAELAVRCEAKGRPVAMADARISAICPAQGAKLATRNSKQFSGLGLLLLNPWGITSGN
jgi:predicted nucleic acid-binding protein